MKKLSLLNYYYEYSLHLICLLFFKVIFYAVLFLKSIKCLFSLLFIQRCIDAIETMRSSPEAIAGYSAALAAVLGGVRLSPLGLPHTKGKVIFPIHFVQLIKFCI